jgi:hypothetical protein
MRVVTPMFHMDQDFYWRWYITSATGQLLAMSTESFFTFEEARENFDLAHAGCWFP